jgi:uncharacterized protein (DUF2141 family)
MKTEMLARPLLLLAAILTFVCGLEAQTTPPNAVVLSGEVHGATGKHTVYVALWDASTFLQKPVQQLKFAAGDEPVFEFHVAPGSWALSAFEDTNENGTLDMGMFGPKEPSGFWRAFHQWRKPRFADVQSSIDKDTSGADIDLHK